ncbi:helix-turn-helix transcriptional regulator [Chitinophaga pendula]|uniref:winged helix-turn-helix transcriptional regulator n=1 Tax=Chitinophaga TaxID=79328 RepID=UPI000BB08C73|nr:MULTISPECIES: helix-turn-helix domain-containing protein [Chitinophaga]ASZ11939.1 transcriptional regulator [Chitinophaga sp. MD30]UCJ05032.1 helix-turn-helix transcriptional regulator [Chitinophaga pendula]
MYTRKNPPTLTCGLDVTGELLYGKWKMRLLYFIHEGHLRPTQLQKKIPDASPRVLLMQLRELEQAQLVVKETYAQVPPKVEYRLTPLGASLIPVIETLGLWGDAHLEELREMLMGRE